MMLLVIFLVALAVAWYLFVFKRRHDPANLFMKMNCSGKPKLRPLTEQEKHDLLRRDFHPSLVKSEWDVIIVGSGLCGLTTAKILCASGRKVLVLEQHDRAGGACHTFELEEYEFDVGIHYVSEMCTGFDAYNVCNAVTESQVQWRKLDDPYDTVYIGNKKYPVMSGDREAFLKQLYEWFPKEKENIDAYFAYMYSCLKEVPWMFRVKYVPAVAVRFLMKTGIFSLLSKVFKYASRTLLEVMEEFKFSPELQTVVSYYFVNYGAPPNRASFLQHTLFYMAGGYFPVGGAGSITANLVRGIENQGGKVLVKADVKRISFENGKVNGVFVDRGNQECFVPAPMVVSTAPLTHVFKDLLPPEISSKSVISKVVDKLNTLDVVHFAAFQAYIGLNGSQKDLNLPANNYVCFRNNDVLETDKYLSLSVEEAIDYGCPPIMFICFPSGKDPEWDQRHPGVSTCQIISIASPEWFKEYKDKANKKSQRRVSKEDYIRLKQTLGESMVDRLLKAFPEISDKIAFTEYSSPLTQQFFMQNNYGELYSLSQQVERFMPEIWAELRVKTDIPGLYLSGQDVLVCGVTSAFHNGLLTSSVILGKNLYNCLNEAVSVQAAEEDKKSE